MKYIALLSAVVLFLTGWTPFGWLALAAALWLHIVLEDGDGELGPR